MNRTQRILSTLPLLLSLLVAPSASASVGPCRVDLDGSGTVDVTDLARCLGGDPKCDVNGDGAVACFDIEYVLGNFGLRCTSCQADIDRDGDVDKTDLSLLLARFGATGCQCDLDQNGAIEGNDADLLQCVFGTAEPRADFDGNGVVDLSDLATLLGKVATPPVSCAADLNGDGKIDTNDLTILLAEFGTTTC